MNPVENRKKMAEIMFETFGIPNLYIANQAVLSLIANGKSDGAIIDLGDSYTHIYPMREYYCPIPNRIEWIDFGGKDLTYYLYKKLVREENQRISLYDAQKIKEHGCYTAFDYYEELGSVDPFDYELPDENHIVIKKERINCPEILFKPEIINKDYDSIALMLYDVMKKVSMENQINIRNFLYNIILSGGNSMFNGFEERLKKEIQYLCPNDELREEVRINSISNIINSPFVGGVNLSQLSTLKWLSKTDYEEYGSNSIENFEY